MINNQFHFDWLWIMVSKRIEMTEWYECFAWFSHFEHIFNMWNVKAHRWLSLLTRKKNKMSDWWLCIIWIPMNFLNRFSIRQNEFDERKYIHQRWFAAFTKGHEQKSFNNFSFWISWIRVHICFSPYFPLWILKIDIFGAHHKLRSNFVFFPFL